ncbi:MAG: PIN domain-containing protein [Acidobacteria bacterium]|nr:PIN domain-containing protein [Acidobacteriota bacterium]MBI3426119.1 PIN domain-containing protein [Acidobacteriota bacterium]
MNVWPSSGARVFPDSNVLIEGLFAPWSVSRALLILARAQAFRLVLSPYVEMEVERALPKRLGHDAVEGTRLIDDYALALRLLAPERAASATREEIETHRSLIRHMNDVPVLVTAIKAQPDWLVTANVEHFSPEVARRTGLKIVTPYQFLQMFKLNPGT